MKIKRAYKIKLYPKPQIAETLNTWFGLCCELYNAAIQERSEAWKRRRKSVNRLEQSKQLTEIKNDERPELMDVNSHVLQDVLTRVDRAFAAFFRRCKTGEKAGYPRYKSRKFYSSITIPNTRYKVDGKWLDISRLGRVKFRCDREIEGKMKSMSIKREGILQPKWYASIITEIELPDLPPVKEPREIGIDVGIESFATLSDGTVIANPRAYQRSQAKLAKAQQIKDSRKRGSNRRRKAAENVRKIHTHIREQRNNFQHHVTKDLVERFDRIAIEDLNVKGMAKNGNLSKHILDAGWSEFRYKLEYKAAAKGKTVVAVNPKNTSQECSGCGETVKKALHVRQHDCPYCGLSLHRDHNAAVNIKNRAVSPPSVVLQPRIFSTED